MQQTELRSINALGRIDVTKEGGWAELESAAVDALNRQERSKIPFALQWFENYSYLMGNHLTRFFYTPANGFGVFQFGIHDSSRFDSVIARSADNRLVHAMESVVGLLTQHGPEPMVPPNSDLPEDEDAATVAGKLLMSLYEQPLRMQRKLRDAVLWAGIGGLAAAEVEYGDTDQPVEIPTHKIRRRKNKLFGKIEGEPEKIEEIVEGEPEVAFTRDIQCRIWSPFHIIPDPGATCEEDLNWIARASFEDAEWVVENYAKDEEGYAFGEDEADKLRDAIHGRSGVDTPLQWFYRVRDIVVSPQQLHGASGLVSSSPEFYRGTAPGQCYFVVLDVKPTRQNPRGRTLVLAGDTLLYVGPARAWVRGYEWRWHPYAFFGWFRTPGRFWPMPLLSELVPLQKRINSIDALVHANRVYISLGQWLIPKHSNVREGRFGGIPGDQFVYTDIPGHSKPERVKNEPLPSDLWNERAGLVASIDQIAATGLTMDQITGSAMRSGPVLDFLNQQKLRRQSPMIADFEGFIERISQNILIECQTQVREGDEAMLQRIAQVAREHSQMSLMAFASASLRDHYAVRIDIRSRIMHSPEARKELAIQFLQAVGQNATQGEKDAALRAMELDEFMMNAQSSTVDRARRMVERIRTGQVQQVVMLPGEEPTAALPIYARAIHSDRFNDMDMNGKMIMIDTYEMYQAAADAQLQQQMAMQSMMMAQSGGK